MTIDFGAHLRSDSAQFAEVLADAEPSAVVPTCPDWNAADLLWHLAEVQWFWGTVVRERLDDPDRIEIEPERPADHVALLAFYRESSRALSEALDHAADDVTVWTWFEADKSAGFVRRRQAHEALIHRVDAELTAGLPVSSVDSALAADGVAEVLDWMYSGVPGWAQHDIDGPVGRVAITDTGDEWLVQLGRWSGLSPNTGKTYADETSLTIVTEGNPSFDISGVARDLDAWLWNRPMHSEVALSGDYARFEQVIRSGVQ